MTEITTAQADYIRRLQADKAFMLTFDQPTEDTVDASMVDSRLFPDYHDRIDALDHDVDARAKFIDGEVAAWKKAEAWKRHTDFVHALTVDTATLSKDDASAVIETLKTGKTGDIAKPKLTPEQIEAARQARIARRAQH